MPASPMKGASGTGAMTGGGGGIIESLPFSRIPVPRARDAIDGRGASARADVECFPVAAPSEDGEGALPPPMDDLPAACCRLWALGGGPSRSVVPTVVTAAAAKPLEVPVLAPMLAAVPVAVPPCDDFDAFDARCETGVLPRGSCCSCPCSRCCCCCCFFLASASAVPGLCCSRGTPPEGVVVVCPASSVARPPESPAPPRELDPLFTDSRLGGLCMLGLRSDSEGCGAGLTACGAESAPDHG